MYRNIESKFWTDPKIRELSPPLDDMWIDHRGRSWKVIRNKGALKFKVPAHRALRAYVFHRHEYACQHCGRQALNIPLNYDGRNTLYTLPGALQGLELDHIVSQLNGGSHHPSNLQTLCFSCNVIKANLLDRKGYGDV